MTWPRAAVLTGVTMQIVSRRLAGRGIEQRTVDVRPEDLGDFSGAAVMNSWSPGVPVAQIGDHRFAADGQFTQALQEAYADEPLITI